MTTTASNLDARQQQIPMARLRRFATAGASLLGAIGSRWNAIVESGQLGPDAERSISRHMGGRI